MTKTLPLWALGIVQGITEALPISSSAHLFFTSKLFGVTTLPLTMTIVLHLGSLLAFITYFWKEMSDMLKGLFFLLRGRTKEKEADLCLSVMLATLPCVCVGGLLQFLGKVPETPPLIIFCSLFFAMVLYVSDKAYVSRDQKAKISLKHAVCIGCAQTLAFLPGVSRLGICLTSARFLGYNRVTAARFSFLMGIGSLSGAVCLEMPTLLAQGHLDFWTLFLVYTITLPLTAIFMWWMKRHTLTPFAVYRVLLGFLFWAFL